jgi:hypothetical protein
MLSPSTAGVPTPPAVTDGAEQHLRDNNRKSGKRLGVALVACAAMLASAGPAEAQLETPREDAPIVLGPLSLYPSVRVVDLGIDENVFNDSTDGKEDFTATISSKVVSALRMGLNQFLFAAGGDYVWFDDYASERSANANYAARFNLSASRFKPFLGWEYLTTRVRVNQEIDERARRVEQLVTTGADFDLTQRTTLTLSAKWAETTFADKEAFRGTELDAALNDRARSLSAGAKYAVTPLTTLLVTGNYVDDVFPDATFRNSKSYSITPIVEFAPEATIRGRFAAGYQVFVPEDPDLAKNRGLIMEGTLNWIVMGVTTFDLVVGRNVNYSYDASQPYYLQTGTRLTVTQRVFGPVSLQGTADHQQLAYRWQRGVDPLSQDRVDTSAIWSGGVLVRMGRGFNVLVGAEKTRRNSPEDVTFNYNRTRLLSNVVIGQ